MTDPLHLLAKEVVDAVAALPLEPRVVTEDGQVAHEALRHRGRRRAGVAGRRRGRLPAASGSAGRRHFYLHDVRTLSSRGRQEAKIRLAKFLRIKSSRVFECTLRTGISFIIMPLC